MKALSALAFVAVAVACAPACRFGECALGTSQCDGNDMLTCVYGEPSCSDCDPPHVQSRATCPSSTPTCEDGAGGAACLAAGTRTDCNARTLADGAPIRVADFDGDRRLDILLATGAGHAIAFANADGTLRVAAAVENAPPASFHTLVGDFDGDGRADLARLAEDGSGLGFALGNGDATFRWTPIASAGLRPIAAADVDGDHASDLVAVDDEGRIVVVLGGPSPRVLAAQPLVCAPACVARPSGIARTDDAFADVRAADFDGDGLDDVLLGSVGGFVVLFGAKGGVLREGAMQPGRPSAAGDFDGDGRADLLFARADRVSVAHGVGDGTFAPAVDSRVVPYVIEDAAALDFDGDGKLDVVARSGAHAYVLAVFRGRGDGTLDDATYIEPTRGVVAVAPFGGATFALGVTEDPNDAASAEHVAIFDAPCK